MESCKKQIKTFKYKHTSISVFVKGTTYILSKNKSLDQSWVKSLLILTSDSINDLYFFMHNLIYVCNNGMLLTLSVRIVCEKCKFDICKEDDPNRLVKCTEIYENIR